MKFGLTDIELAYLHKAVITPLKRLGAKVYIFGSRARGNHRRFSDVDILVDSPADLSSAIGPIVEEIEESNFPYKIDLVEDHSIADSYRSSIYRDRITL